MTQESLALPSYITTMCCTIVSFRVQVATVGRSQQPILNGYRVFGGDVVVLLPSPETEAEAKEIAKKVDDLAGRAVCEIRAVDKFDLPGIVREIRQVHRDHPDAEIFVNITGGTNVMASSALVACFIVGGHAYYMREEAVAGKKPLKETAIELPVPRVGIDDLSDQQARVLRLIRRNGGTLRTANRRIANELDVSFQDASYHLKRLSSFGLIRVATEGREKVAELTAEGDLYAGLLGK